MPAPGGHARISPASGGCAWPTPAPRGRARELLGPAPASALGLATPGATPELAALGAVLARAGGVPAPVPASGATPASTKGAAPAPGWGGGGRTRPWWWWRRASRRQLVVGEVGVKKTLA